MRARARAVQDACQSRGRSLVDKLTSILAVIDPADETRHVVAKAMVLARHFRARLELFLCYSEQVYSLRQDRKSVV